MTRKLTRRDFARTSVGVGAAAMAVLCALVGERVATNAAAAIR